MQLVERRVASLTSWFRVPEQGMTNFEPLSRSTCFCVASPMTDRVHFLASQHVTHPHRYRQYYPGESFGWLDFVNESHLKYTLELRNDNGEIALQTDFSRHSDMIIRHPKQDVVCLHLDDMNAFGAALDDCGMHLDILELDARGSRGGHHYRFEGHNACGGWNKATETDETRLEPHQEIGTILAGLSDDSFARMLHEELLRIISDRQTKGQSTKNISIAKYEDTDALTATEMLQFERLVSREDLERAFEQIYAKDPRPRRRLASTANILEMGMCGGPVIDERTELVVGAVEGIVSTEHPQFPGAGIVIDSRELFDFVANIDEEFEARESKQQTQENVEFAQKMEQRT